MLHELDYIRKTILSFCGEQEIASARWREHDRFAAHTSFINNSFRQRAAEIAAAKAATSRRGKATKDSNGDDYDEIDAATAKQKQQQLGVRRTLVFSDDDNGDNDSLCAIDGDVFSNLELEDERACLSQRR
jgi:cytoplasmic iron level regulating protein YaaA (DUF328/UPF0246 family)